MKSLGHWSWLQIIGNSRGPFYTIEADSRYVRIFFLISILVHRWPKNYPDDAGCTTKYKRALGYLQGQTSTGKVSTVSFLSWQWKNYVWHFAKVGNVVTFGNYWWKLSITNNLWWAWTSRTHNCMYPCFIVQKFH